MPIKTILFILLLLLLFIGGPLYYFRSDIEFPSFLKGMVSDSKPIFSPEEICEMISFNNADGKAGYLVQKGYKEKRVDDYKKEIYRLWEKKYALFPLKKGIKAVIPTDPDNGYLFDIVFNEDKKEEYLKFLNQFSKITVPFPKGNETTTEIEHLVCSKNYVRAEGYVRGANGYVVLCYNYGN